MTAKSSIYTKATITKGHGPFLVARCLLETPEEHEGRQIYVHEIIFADLESIVAERDPDHQGPGTKLCVKADADPVLADVYEKFLALVTKPLSRNPEPAPEAA